MSNSLTDIRHAEKYLFGDMAAEESAVYEAKLLTDPALNRNVHFLQKTFALLQLYRRKQINQQAEAIHSKLFNDPNKQDLRNKIFHLFKQ